MSATNIAFMRARRGREQVLAKALQELVGLSRSNPGCGLSNLHRSEDDPAMWFLYESWLSHEALWAHLGTDAVQAFVERVAPWLESDFGMRNFRLLAPVNMTTTELAA